MMFNERETFVIEQSKLAIKNLVFSKKLLWNGITRNVVIAGGFFTSTIQNSKFKDIDIFVLNNDVSVYNDLTQGFVRQSMAGPDTMRVTDDPTGQKEWSRSEIMKYNHNPNILDVINNNHTKAQYILTTYKTREELLAHFDYKHCKVSYVPQEDKLYINRETFDCIKNKILKWNNKQLDNPNQIYRKNKFLNEGWVLETDVTPVSSEYKALSSDMIQDSYQKLKEEIAAKALEAYGLPAMQQQKSYLDEILDAVTNPSK